MFAALGNFYDNVVDIIRAWKTIWESSKIVAKDCLGCNELQRQKPRFDGDYSKSEITEAG